MLENVYLKGFKVKYCPKVGKKLGVKYFCGCKIEGIGQESLRIISHGKVLSLPYFFTPTKNSTPSFTPTAFYPPLIIKIILKTLKSL